MKHVRSRHPGLPDSVIELEPLPKLPNMKVMSDPIVLEDITCMPSSGQIEKVVHMTVQDTS